MATQQNNTMAEGLSKILKDLASMKIEPDADMPFLISLETDILNYLKPPVPQQPSGPASGAQGGPMGPGGAMGQAMGQVMGGGAPPMGGGGVPGMGAPGMVGMGMPNPDEFARGLGIAAGRRAGRQLVSRLVNLPQFG